VGHANRLKIKSYVQDVPTSTANEATLRESLFLLQTLDVDIEQRCAQYEEGQVDAGGYPTVVSILIIHFSYVSIVVARCCKSVLVNWKILRQSWTTNIEEQTKQSLHDNCP
jgi:hypothetical protein